MVEKAHSGDLQQMKDIVDEAMAKKQKIGKLSDGKSGPQYSQAQKSDRKQNNSHLKNSI